MNATAGAAGNRTVLTSNVFYAGHRVGEPRKP
jgi:hypothetical protein